MPETRKNEPIDQPRSSESSSVFPSHDTPVHAAAHEATFKSQSPVPPGTQVVPQSSVTEADGSRSGASSLSTSITSPVDVTAGPPLLGAPDNSPAENSPPSSSATGTQVGRFTLRGLHARGGLGEVFTARDRELNRDVALKRIQARYADDAASRRRFLTEAEITARLDHPGVVPVFGLVLDTFERPCYAMRFIRGETLKDEIERYYGTEPSSTNADTKIDGAVPSEPKVESLGQPRSIAFRHLLQRFIAVCQTIAYAHTRKVIHRDIKPANVMVGAFGETLVVDWGLAKALDDDPNPELLMRKAAAVGFRHDPDATELPSHMTLAGTAVGTPAYMSPEQASGRLELLSPASDVYSLGATLFAILTGKAPFAGNATETLDKVRRGDFPAPISVNPEVSPPLNAICEKAMSLRPADRYATPLELAADIECWLSDEPVSCYRDPVAARLARWARRHPARVATTLSLLLAGILAAIGMAWAVSHEQQKTQEALVKVTEAEAQAARERDQVKIEQGRTKLALEDVTRQKLETDKQRSAAIEARDVARERYAAAVNAFNTLVTNIQTTLADRAGTQRLRRELLAEAQTGLKKLIAKSGAEKIGGDRILVVAHRQMGDVYQLLGNTREALKEYSESVKLAIDVLIDAQERKSIAAEREAQQEYGLSSLRLADAQLQAGNTAAARRACETALDLFNKTLEQNHDDRAAQENLAAAQDQFGDVLIERGETAAASQQCLEALKVRRQLAANPADLAAQRKLADSLDQYAEILIRSSKSAEAAKFARECLEVRKKVYDQLPEHPGVRRELAAAYIRLGQIQLERGDLTSCKANFEQARDLLQKLCKDDPGSAGAKGALGICHGWLADTARENGDLAAAFAEATTGKKLCKEVDLDDPDSMRTTREHAESLQRLGDVLIAQNKPSEALALYQESEKLLAPIVKKDPDSIRVKLALAHALERVGEGQLAVGNVKEAVDAFASSVALREKVLAVDEGSTRASRELAHGLGRLADAYRASRKRVLARDTVSRQIAILRPLVNADPMNSPARRDLARATSKWGEVLAEDNKPTLAMIAFAQSLDQFKALARADEEDSQAQAEYAASWERLGNMRAQVGLSEHAISAANEALAIRKAVAKKAGQARDSYRELAVAYVRFADTHVLLNQLAIARSWYEAAQKISAETKDRVAGSAAEKLAILDGVDAIIKDPRNGLKGVPESLHVPVLKIASKSLLANKMPNLAAEIAWQLANKAVTPEDRYQAARVLAQCEGHKDFAIKALHLAVKVDFADAELLGDPVWDSCRKEPEFQNIVKSLAVKASTPPGQ